MVAVVRSTELVLCSSSIALSHIISLLLCGTAGFSCLLTLSLQAEAKFSLQQRRSAG